LNKLKLLEKILNNQKNLKFSDFLIILNGFGFILDRTNGSHHIYKHPNVNELINIQEVKGEVKPYQIKQFFKLVEKYNLDFQE